MWARTAPRAATVLKAVAVAVAVAALGRRDWRALMVLAMAAAVAAVVAVVAVEQLADRVAVLRSVCCWFAVPRR
jgi:uncharacterized membrane protein YfcA